MCVIVGAENAHFSWAFRRVLMVFHPNINSSPMKTKQIDGLQGCIPGSEDLSVRNQLLIFFF